MTPAVAALRRARVAHRLLEYRHDPAVASYGMEAVEVLGLPAAAVFKTLVLSAPDSRLAVAMVPVTAEVDLKAAAAALGWKRAALAEAATAERATGYVLGGISPFGQKRRLPAVLDQSARAQALVYVSGGRRGLEIELSPAALIEQTGAALAALARHRAR
ncbi:Cys-tRNA(Pro) deacylase [Sediminicurvatus halobius]|uniref:Cys-tRNA(Pro)/Cys-tRNA(Cys) deacylase n=1 Tax=Sediminicurvatus halobius TaxID=2182432 RepID=A0A2U2MVT2_9GAMM|nr:Cys-tRNA(Pro) deacylase [Spiribacter halobius]PWG60969.1 Cys-tRNA(Pro) deacylase [Spiribacter halobius]UEX78672.1 Cys-tRNA(Pro) deacylase [Spiribacter halobius]